MPATRLSLLEESRIKVYAHNRHKMRITTFGSCRQHSVAKVCNLTNIQETLTYPHYTKEVIQAIEFCKGVGLSDDKSRYAFRTALLTGRHVTSNNYRKQYEETDLFIVEIASRLCYTYDDYYVHHIATEAKYGFQHRDKISIHSLSDSEIESDILRIRELLDGKPLIIVSHMYSYTHGKRYELVTLLRDICKKHDIPFFDPVEQLAPVNIKDITTKEHVLAHYTQQGHTLIAAKYKEMIDRVLYPDRVNMTA